MSVGAELTDLTTSSLYFTQLGTGTRIPVHCGLDWPRIPPFAAKDALVRSAELGRQVAALLDTERDVPGVTEGKIEQPIRSIAIISRVGGGTLRTNGENNETQSYGWLGTWRQRRHHYARQRETHRTRLHAGRAQGN